MSSDYGKGSSFQLAVRVLLNPTDRIALYYHQGMALSFHVTIGLFLVLHIRSQGLEVL